MSQKVTVSEGGRMRRVSRVELMLLRLVNDAARSDPRATKLALERSDRYGQPTDGDARSVELSVSCCAPPIPLSRRLVDCLGSRPD